MILSLLLIAAQLSQVTYQMLNDRKKTGDDRVNEHRLGALLHKELHGHGTMEVVSADAKETTAIDVDMALHCALANLGSKGIQLTRYAVNVLSNGQWIWFNSITLGKPHFLVTHPASNPQGQYTDVSNDCLDEAIGSRTLAPGASIGGWAFLRIPSNCDHRFVLEQMRIEAWDMEGRHYDIQPKRVNEEGNNKLLNIAAAPP